MPKKVKLLTAAQLRKRLVLLLGAPDLRLEDTSIGINGRFYVRFSVDMSEGAAPKKARARR